MLIIDRHSERGAGTLEYLGVLIIAGALVTALLAPMVPIGKNITDNFAYVICQVTTLGQGGCSKPDSIEAEEHKPEEPCTVSQNGVERNSKVSVIVVTAEDGRRIQIEKLSNGEYRVTSSDTNGVGAEVGVGGGLSVTVNDTTVGGNASASAGASLDVADGDVYYTDQDGLSDLMNELTQDEVKDQTVGDSGPVRWLTDKASDVTGVGSNLREPDETFVEGGFSVNAGAEATGGTDSASAGVSAAQTLGMRNNRDGSTTYYLKSTVEGRAGLQSLGIDTEGVDFNGAAVEGKAEVVTAVTMDSNGNMTDVKATTVAAGSSKGYATAMFGGELDGDLSNTESNASVMQATLPIETDADREVANNYLLNMGVGAMGGWTNPALAYSGYHAVDGFFDATADRGYMTDLSYDTNSNTVFGVNASGKLGVELGVQADVKEDSMDLTDAKYWDGSQWADWEECAA